MIQSPKIIVIGAGISGMMSALTLLDQGYAVTLLSSAHPLKAAATGFYGGINAALKEKTEDTVENHGHETLMVGEDLASPTMVREICVSAPQWLGLLQSFGVSFDAGTDGFPKAYPTEASGQKRTYQANYQLGRYITEALFKQICIWVQNGRLSLLTNQRLLAVSKNKENIGVGVICLNEINLQIEFHRTDAVIFCTGGFAQPFFHPLRGTWAEMDAQAIFLQHGLALANLEFFQVHPLAIKDSQRKIPLTTKLIQTNQPIDFFAELFPQGLDTIPFIVLGRAMQKIFKGTEASVKLDGETQLVQPTMTHSLGGLAVDRNYQTSVSGFFAAGQCQAEGHGANALDGNHLLVSLHSGVMAARGAISHIKTKTMVPTSNLEAELIMKHFEKRLQRLPQMEGKESVWNLMLQAQEIMTTALGLVRDNQQLSASIEALDSLKLRGQNISLGDKSTYRNQELIETLLLDERLEFLKTVLLCAQLRDESRGCHYKPAFPTRNDEKFRKQSFVTWAGSAQISFTTIAPS